MKILVIHASFLFPFFSYREVLLIIQVNLMDELRKELKISGYATIFASIVYVMPFVQPTGYGSTSLNPDLSHPNIRLLFVD